MLLTSRVLVVGASETDAHFAFDVCETPSFAFGITHLLSLIVKFPVHSVTTLTTNDWIRSSSLHNMYCGTYGKELHSGSVAEQELSLLIGLIVSNFVHNVFQRQFSLS